MKILTLIIENVLKIKAAAIKTIGNVVMVQGGNGAGKSSVLDSIVIALKGGRDIPEQPITKGADKGAVRIDFGDFTLIRSLTKKGAYLKIESSDGSEVKSPQDFLNKLIGNISFDPLAFINEDSAKQRKVLMEIAGIDVEDLNAREKDIYDRRTEASRESARTEGKMKASKRWPDVKNTEPIQVSTLTKKLEGALTHNASRVEREKANAQLRQNALLNKDSVAANVATITELKTRIEILEKENKELNESIEAARIAHRTEKEALENFESIDVEAIQKEISDIEGTNSKIRDNQAADTALSEFQAAKKNYDALDRDLNSVRQEKVDLIAKAKIPVPGLTFDDSQLLYNGIPLAQASDGEKLMVGMRMSMALNPTLRVLRIKDGSLIDKKNMAILVKLCEEGDYQLWIEKVSDHDDYVAAGKVGIFIEEGEIIDGSEMIAAPPPSEDTKPEGGKSKATKGKSKPEAPPAEKKKQIDDTF